MRTHVLPWLIYCVSAHFFNMCFTCCFAQNMLLGHHIIFELCITQKEQGLYALLSLLTASLRHSDVDEVCIFFLYHIGEDVCRLCIGI